MKQLILAGAVALSSIAAPLAANACDDGAYGYQPTGYQPAYVQPTYVQPTYVQPTYVQPQRVFVRRGGFGGWGGHEFRGGGRVQFRGGWHR